MARLCKTRRTSFAAWAWALSRKRSSGSRSVEEPGWPYTCASVCPLVVISAIGEGRGVYTYEHTEAHIHTHNTHHAQKFPSLELLLNEIAHVIMIIPV